MQPVISGLTDGLNIALLALAFQLAYLPTRVFYLGLAGIYTLAAYMGMALFVKFGFFWLSLGLSVFACAALSLANEQFNHKPLAKKGASAGGHLIATLGVYIIIVQIVAMIWGNEAQTLRVGVDDVYTLAGASITRSQALTITVSLGLLLSLVYMLQKTSLGLRLRGLADNPNQFALYGFNVNLYRLIAFGLAGAVAAVASLLTSIDIGFDLHSGLNAVLLAVVAVIVGGRSSFYGPILGGLLLGVIRAQVVWQLSARWQEAVTFAILVLVLLLRPQGLLISSSRVEARTS